MGEAKEKQKNNTSILLANPFCCFCGEKAVTVDHCPPRCFFVKRQWPDGYAFSCCKACNNFTRDDEQLLAVLTRISISKERSDVEIIELNKLLTGVRNNQPEVLQEWSNMSPTRLKRFYRESFGSSGDKLRHSGLSALNIGQVTLSALNRFIAKLAKALYYKHVCYRCNGTITFGMIDAVTYNIKEDYINSIQKITPCIPEIKRNNVNISSQFSYRFSANVELGAFVALVHFGEQLLVQLIVLSKEMAEKVNVKPDDRFTISAV